MTKTAQALSAIVCAAGTSSRLGINKLTLPLVNENVLLSMVARVEAAGFGEIVVVLGYEIEQHLADLAGKPIVITYNPRFEESLAFSIRSGAQASSPASQGMAIILADLYTLSVKRLSNLSALFMQALTEDHQCILRPSYRGRLGHPVFFSPKYRQELTQLNADYDQQALIKKFIGHQQIVPVEDSGVIQDLDTPADLNNLIRFNYLHHQKD